jgi:hypothetical protein
MTSLFLANGSRHFSKAGHKRPFSLKHSAYGISIYINKAPKPAWTAPLPLTNAYVSKRLFRENIPLLGDLLPAVLGLKPEDCPIIQGLDPHLKPESTNGNVAGWISRLLQKQARVWLVKGKVKSRLLPGNACRIIAPSCLPSRASAATYSKNFPK